MPARPAQLVASIVVVLLAVVAYKFYYVTFQVTRDSPTSTVPAGWLQCSNGDPFPPSWLNDGLCDCALGVDGHGDEPATGACPSTRFSCSHGFFAQDIHSSHVNDGILDCCDGSDEFDGRTARLSDAQAADACGLEVAVRAEALRERIRALQAALVERQALIEAGPAALKREKKRLSRLRKRLDRGRDKLQALAAGGTASQDVLNAEYQRLTMLQARVQSLTVLLKKAPPTASFGAELEFMALASQCFSTQWVQKRFGHMGVEEDEYHMEVCPFQNATQYTQDGGRFSLGLFGGWRGGFDTMRFKGGDQCWMGPRRSVDVSVRCGGDTRLVQVEENGKCTYEFVLETPAACRPESVSHLQRELALYEHPR